MSKNQPEQLTYAVIVYRKDDEHIIVAKSEDFSEIKKLWTDLKDKWINAHKEVIPFVIDGTDILCDITCFEPGLVKEIKIEAVSGNVIQGNTDNPYMKKMMQQGFAGSFQGQGQSRAGIDLLDKGYNF